MRIVAGLVAGGVFPVAMALIGDLVPVQQRQVAIGRLLAIGLTGNLLGASIAGVIADFFGWRGVFVVLGLFGLIVAITAFFAFRSVAVAKPTLPFNRAAVIAGFRGIFADPRAKVCFSAVFCEAIFIHGLFPFVAILLLAAGERALAIAGTRDRCVRNRRRCSIRCRSRCWSPGFPTGGLMIVGGTLAAIGLALTALHFPWYVQVGIFFMMGFGFYLLHGSIQVHVTELSPTARGSATSLHSCFFYLGQAVGPVIYGFGFATWRAGAESAGRRRRGDDGRAGLRAIAAAPDRIPLRGIPLRGLSNGPKIPIMAGYGIGCRGVAAEITPIEPVWVIPAKGAAV